MHYFGKEISDVKWGYFNGMPGNSKEDPVGRVDDIWIRFSHTWDFSEIKKKWKVMCRYVNSDRIICILTDQMGGISLPVMQEFSQLEYKHIFMLKDKGAFYLDRDISADIHFGLLGYMFMDDDAIENHFDLLGWLNKEY